MNKATLIKTALEQEGRTLKWLSRKTGIPYNTMAGWTSGKSNPKEPDLRLIAYVMGLPFSFFGLDDHNISQSVDNGAA